MNRSDGRKNGEFRKITITPNFLKYADGSALIECGDTKVICSAFLEDRVPPHKKDTGSGWLTAEYAMLPGSSQNRIRRDSAGKVSGRSQEIQRLIGRSLRAVCDLNKMGEKTIIMDADVLQADGGTRCAAITGSFVALKLAVRKFLKERKIKADPILEYVAAISVGKVAGYELVDLNYSEDSQAEVDMNLILDGKGNFIEVQATAEGIPFPQEVLNSLVSKGREAVMKLVAIQKEILGE
ncbi:ribonuclease PH [candidate division WOR-1 bacterium RIFOXYA12_FULL_43_27]|uniref:Ribonuclease PH n=1 Tax=candidate division WOR-1 bacterium RIFOXYC2_FULL_46_14 TaxID=1802587 RepID=A0A1F4U3P4_UNCSA|nr:MAG: ribonuclease PH [candidate division WOR-1 bacterium RIFOXYA12_FULL_43_27]OGC20131.1 MAG: ribonuclease PH [candidate division WOR-1 bacterium RIFOXYB2_FULL_46_45]OGC32132.1 MAG: ribonuclease PH [candidate division WOR-1 bacterium RIFOXYA2_FULL_46_56]OGC39532.1 MAG: ribonuclease PH [candidate division WOR-1 bacterium RIFOXYC2_FULL_46_14]